MHAGGCDCKISVYSFCTGNRNPVLYMGKQALQRMDGRNDCGNYNDRDEYIRTSDSEYGEKALILGISEGVIVFALAVLFHYGIGMGSQIFRERHKNRVEEEGVETMVGMDPQGRIHAFAGQLTSFPWHLPRWTAGKCQNSRIIWIFLPRRLPESCVRTAMDVSCV